MQMLNMPKMEMHNAILDFNSQFAYEPRIENKEKLIKPRWHIVAGMGGSHLAADLLKAWNPYLPLLVHKNYGLPKVPNEILKNSMVIASSYSGNTEETLDVYEEARKKDISCAAMSIGGKLLERAKKDGIPYIQMPNSGIQPRSALGFSVKALLALMDKKEALLEISKLASNLKPSDFEGEGKALAKKLKNYVPVIYSSEQNEPIAYNWKIKFNETGKIPSFYNVFSELNHNEMTGFDVKENTRNLTKQFHFILLKDETDHPRVQKRMAILENLYKDRNLPVTAVELNGNDIFYKIFSSLLVADFAAYHTAKEYGLEPAEVPMIEEFKKLVG